MLFYVAKFRNIETGVWASDALSAISILMTSDDYASFHGKKIDSLNCHSSPRNY